ncbi:hypothetical protein MPNT_10111 [Candidatus Methylacidithermus pantelleriae]|uniref:Uncharacterized protein n=1 Tax=Candidatus Methylacidithermus pantelleriae TaxID=2744239 RepID=A0A8J2BH37_9BACT|nr:hypothetical protein MPNT_10111 [Candidatus Methylacidithermus pantelleriae]
MYGKNPVPSKKAGKGMAFGSKRVAWQQRKRGKEKNGFSGGHGATSYNRGGLEGRNRRFRTGTILAPRILGRIYRAGAGERKAQGAGSFRSGPGGTHGTLAFLWPGRRR